MKCLFEDTEGHKHTANWSRPKKGKKKKAWLNSDLKKKTNKTNKMNFYPAKDNGKKILRQIKL